MEKKKRITRVDQEGRKLLPLLVPASMVISLKRMAREDGRTLQGLSSIIIGNYLKSIKDGTASL